MATDEYVASVRAWQAEMDSNLRRPNGWLALAGLFWLKSGINTLGSSPDCDIRLPRGAPPLLGALAFDGTNVTLELDVGQTVDINGIHVASASQLASEEEVAPSYVSHKDLRMVVIRRANGTALRIWDNQQPARQDFPARVWFEPSLAYRVQGLYTPYPVPVKVDLPNFFGEVESGYVQGYVSFKLAGKSHRLDATEEDEGRLNLRFSDATSGGQTYAAGRYLYTEPVREDGLVWVDFNYAYNPPCAFTPFATCSFAPKRNRLNVTVEAGERYQPHA